jgi:hypothetical protein
MRTALVWDATQRRTVVTDDLGQCVGHIFPGQAVIDILKNVPKRR